MKEPPAIQQDKDRKVRNDLPCAILQLARRTRSQQLAQNQAQVVPTWTNCRFRMFSRHRRWQRRLPPGSEQCAKLRSVNSPRRRPKAVALLAPHSSPVLVRRLLLGTLALAVAPSLRLLLR